jgi:hypothetical protein
MLLTKEPHPRLLASLACYATSGTIGVPSGWRKEQSYE